MGSLRQRLKPRFGSPSFRPSPRRAARGHVSIVSLAEAADSAYVGHALRKAREAAIRAVVPGVVNCAPWIVLRLGGRAGRGCRDDQGKEHKHSLHGGSAGLHLSFARRVFRHAGGMRRRTGRRHIGVVDHAKAAHAAQGLHTLVVADEAAIRGAAKAAAILRAPRIILRFGGRRVGSDADEYSQRAQREKSAPHGSLLRLAVALWN